MSRQCWFWIMNKAGGWEEESMRPTTLIVNALTCENKLIKVGKKWITTLVRATRNQHCNILITFDSSSGQRREREWKRAWHNCNRASYGQFFNFISSWKALQASTVTIFYWRAIILMRLLRLVTVRGSTN